MLAAIKILLPYFSLGIITFFSVVIFSSISFPPHKPQKKILAQAVTNSKVITNLSPAASPSETPTATITITPTPSTDFCLHVPVLLYHHIQPMDIAQERGQSGLTVDTTVFDQQMEYLVTHGYKTTSAEVLVNALRHHIYLPANTIVVTLDDSYLDNYTDAFPIAKKYNVVLNIMVPTGLLDTSFAANEYFSWEQLKEMGNSGLVYAYNHTWSHYPLGMGSTEKNQFEINTAKEQLEYNLGKPMNIFAYPYGSGQDEQRVIDQLKSNGVTGAYSTNHGTTQCKSFIMSLHRTRIGSAYFPEFGIH